MNIMSPEDEKFFVGWELNFRDDSKSFQALVEEIRLVKDKCFNLQYYKLERD